MMDYHPLPMPPKHLFDTEEDWLDAIKDWEKRCDQYEEHCEREFERRRDERE